MLFELIGFDDLEEFRFEYQDYIVTKVFKSENNRMYSVITASNGETGITQTEEGERPFASTKVVWLEDFPVVVWQRAAFCKLIYPVLDGNGYVKKWIVRDMNKNAGPNYFLIASKKKIYFHCSAASFSEFYFTNTNITYRSNHPEHSEIMLIERAAFLKHQCNNIRINDREVVEKFKQGYIKDLHHNFLYKIEHDQVFFHPCYNESRQIFALSLYCRDDNFYTIYGNYQLPLTCSHRAIGFWYGDYYIYQDNGKKVYTPWKLDLVKYMSPIIKSIIITILLCIKYKALYKFAPRQIWLNKIFPIGLMEPPAKSSSKCVIF